MVQVSVEHGQSVLAKGFDELMEFVKRLLRNREVTGPNEVCGDLGDLWVCTDFKTYLDIWVRFDGSATTYISIER